LVILVAADVNQSLVGLIVIIGQSLQLICQSAAKQQPRQR
jgi:hypothetical protein